MPGQQRCPLLLRIGAVGFHPSFSAAAFFVTKCVRRGIRNNPTHIPGNSHASLGLYFRHARGAAHPDRRRSSRDPRSRLARADQGGIPGQHGGGWPSHAQGPGRRPDRPHPARSHAAGRGRAVALPCAACRVEHPDHHADREGRRGRPRHRPGNGRRRLSAEAVRQPRAHRAHQGGAAPQPGEAAQRRAPEPRPKRYHFDRWGLDTGARELASR